MPEPTAASSYPTNPFDDSVPDVPTEDVLAEVECYEAARTLRFSPGDRVRVTYGIWADRGLVGTVSEPAPSAWDYDWWVKFDEREFPIMFHDRELVKTDA